MKIQERWQGTEEKTCLINVNLEGKKLPTKINKCEKKTKAVEEEAPKLQPNATSTQIQVQVVMNKNKLCPEMCL